MERTEPELIETIMARRIMSMPEFEALIDARVERKLQMKLDSLHLNQSLSTPEELAERFKIEKQTVYAYVRRGWLKPTWFGRNMRFTTEAVQNCSMLSENAIVR